MFDWNEGLNHVTEWVFIFLKGFSFMLLAETLEQ